MKLSENFSSEEFACKCGCGFDLIDPALILILEDVRAHFNKFYAGKVTIKINSGCRCPEHNANEGGAERSQHLPAGHYGYAGAADFVVKHDGAPIDQDKVADYLEGKYPHMLGIGRYRGRTHVDVRTGCARWDKR